MNSEKKYSFLWGNLRFLYYLCPKNGTVECCVHNNKVYNFN